MAAQKMMFACTHVPVKRGEKSEILDIFSNEVFCRKCMRTFKSKQAFYNHTKSNGCVGDTMLLCFCGSDLNHHYCKMLGTVRCSFCARSFKNLEAGMNHCMNDHHDGTYWNISKFLIYDDLSYVNDKIVPIAQGFHSKPKWNEKVLKDWFLKSDRAGKRKISRTVMKNSFDYKTLMIVSVRGKVICWFKKPSTCNLHIYEIVIPEGKFQVHLDANQNDYSAIYEQIEPLIVNKLPSNKHSFREYNRLLTEKFQIPVAQGFFDFTVNHHHDITPVIEQLTELAHQTFKGDNLKKILSIITKIGICYSSNWNINTISLSFLDLFLSFDIPLENANSAIKILAVCLPMLVTALLGRVGQDNSDEYSPELIKAVGTVISIVFGTIFLKNIPTKTSIDEFVNSATKFGNLVRAIDNSWKGLGKLVSFMYDYCFEYFYGYSREIGEAEKFISGVENWSIEVGRLSNNEVLEKIQVDPILCRQIEKLYLEGVTYTTRCSHLKLTPEMRRAIENCQRIIQSLNDRVSKSGAFCSGPKVEPLIIQLFGESGVGKSGMMYLLSGDILKTEDLLCGGTGVVADDWANQIYPRNVEQEFFDGYRNQLIVLYDDFGQMRDSQTKPNIEFMEMIRFGNLAPMCLHMAALEQKDKTYFSSKCVLLSSNCREYAIESLISRSAFMRRIDLSVEVRVKEEWRKTNSVELDTEKVVEHFNSPLVPEVYECRIWRNNQPSPIWISYESMRTIACKQYASKMNRHFELTSILSEYMKVPISVDVSKIREELNKKFKTTSYSHYTLDELVPRAQGEDEEEEYFDTQIPKVYNCSPWISQALQTKALTNQRKWSRKRFNAKAIDEFDFFVFATNSSEKDWQIKILDFRVGIMNALEIARGDWKVVMHFISQHFSFLTIKTQIFFQENTYPLMQDPEKWSDFIEENQILCENGSKCWHGDLSNQRYGFQEGCQDDLREFMLAKLNSAESRFYDSFFSFEKVETSKIYQISHKVLNFIDVIKSDGAQFLKDCANWFSNNTDIIVLISYCSIIIGAIYGTYRGYRNAMESSVISDYDEAKKLYEEAYMKYRLALEKLRSAEVNLTHKHEGFALGDKVNHSHECENCGMTFFHKHIIKTEEESKKFKHLCKKCRTIKSEFQSGDSVTTHLNRIKVENSQSGDNVTTHLNKVKVENSQSGDNVTSHLNKPKVETSQSGDSVTTHLNKIKVEDNYTTEHLKFKNENDNYRYFFKEVLLDSNIDDEELFQKQVSTSLHPNNPLTAELSSDPNAMTLGKKVYANTYMISTRMNGDDSWKQHVNCVFVRGRIAVTVAHLEPILVQKSSGYIKIDGPFKPEGYVIPIKELMFKKMTYSNGEQKDAMIIAFPNVVHDHQDIMSSIVDSETMSKFNSVPAMLITPTIIKDRAIFNQRFANAVSVNNENPLPYIDRNSTTGLRYLRMHYQYVMHTTSGDCGSMLVAMSNYLPKKIIGLHVAGDAAGKGYAVPLNVKDIEDLLKDIPREAQIKLDLSKFEIDSELSDTPEGDFTPALKSFLFVASPTKTALRRSLIYGKVLEPITAPAALSRHFRLEDGQFVDPIMNGLKKTGKIPPFLEPELIKSAINDILRIHQTNDQTRKRVLTNMEALTGVVDDPYSNPLNRSSSPGYPWIMDRKGKGKMKWTSDFDGEYKMHKELENAVEEREQMALVNERSPTIWIDTLKDERRPFEKVNIGKTRVFAAGPMDFIVTFRKYFLGFCAHLADFRIDNEVAIGINPYSYDWTKLAIYLKRYGNHVVAGDFGNFDGTLNLQILDEIGKMINDWYDDGENNRQIRTVLWKELTNSVHVEGDNIYFWTHGHPSGHPLTAVLNSLYNSVVCRIVFVLSARDVGKFVTMKDFNENVSMISYGDDNILNISERVIEWFNQHTMSENFAKIGMEYTDELKSAANQTAPYRRLEEVSFLKRTFRFDIDRNCYVAPLNYAVCMEMVNWIRGELDVEEACCVNCQTSAMELSLHGKEIFERSTKLIKDACLKSMQRQPMILTYNEYLEFFSNSYGQLIQNLD